MVLVKGVKGPSGEFGAVGVVEVAGDAATVYRFIGERRRVTFPHHPGSRLGLGVAAANGVQ